MESNENKGLAAGVEESKEKTEGTVADASAEAAGNADEWADIGTEAQAVTEEAKDAEEVKEEVKTSVSTVEKIKSEAKEFSLDTDNLKNETSSTINEVRETIKKVNIKDDTEATKGFLMKFIKDPLDEMRAIATTDGAFFKTAIVMMIVWMAAMFVQRLTHIIDGSFTRIFRLSNLFSLVRSTIAPCVGVIVMALIVLVLNKKSKKSLIAIITTVVLAKTPYIVAEVVSILTVISSGISKITSPLSGICSAISVVLLYFGLKEIFGEEDDNEFMKTFIMIEVIYFIAKIIFTLLGIYI